MVNIKEDLEFKLKMPDFAKKIKLEWLFLIVFAAFLLLFIARYEGGLLEHGSPYQLIAGDMFTFATLSEVAKDTSQYTFLPPYMAAGIEDAAHMFSPTPGIIVAQLALFTGVETYDTLLHLNIFLLILMIVGTYLALRYINREIAMAGVVLGLLMWKWPLTYVINWGAQFSVVNFFFVIAGLLAFYFLKERFMFIVFGIINAAGFIAHGREFQTFNIAVVVFFFVCWAAEKFDYRKIDWLWVKNYLLSLIVTLIFLFRYIPIWKDFGEGAKPPSVMGTFIKYCPLNPDSYHYISFSHLGIFKWLIFLGIVAAVLVLIKEIKKKPQLGFAVIYSLMFVISGYFCIYGNKTTQIRHFFPIFLIPLLGIGIYFAVSFLKGKIKTKIPLIIAVIGITLMIYAWSSHYPNPVAEYPVSNPYTWEGIKWVQQNTEENARILVLYGDNFNQETLFYLLKRPFYKVLEPRYYDTIRTGVLTTRLNMTFSIVGNHYTRESLFKLKRTGYTDENGNNLKEFKGSICDFDYVFSNKGSSNEAVMIYTQLLLTELIERGNFGVVFNNDFMVILQNDNVGGECPEDRRLV